MNAHVATFENYYSITDDPWGLRTRWYERRKRDLLVACLPHESYARAWEIGCSNGELAAALAPRCEQILATDGNLIALAAADRRLADFPGATTEQLWVPEQWPTGRFDLIVVSEMAYYLDAVALEKFCLKLIDSLLVGGTFVACHWRPPITGCTMAGDEIHQMISQLMPWTRTVHHLENDFILEVWMDNAKSIAEQGGLR